MRNVFEWLQKSFIFCLANNHFVLWVQDLYHHTSAGDTQTHKLKGENIRSLPFLPEKHNHRHNYGCQFGNVLSRSLIFRRWKTCVSNWATMKGKLHKSHFWQAHPWDRYLFPILLSQSQLTYKKLRQQPMGLIWKQWCTASANKSFLVVLGPPQYFI